MKHKFYLFKWGLVFLLCFASTWSYGQETTVTGMVLDETNLPMPGVTVMVKGTNIGTITDIDGNYAINVPANGVLSYSFIGYVVMAESTVLEDYIKGEKDKSCRYFKMVNITNLKAKTAEKLLKELLDKQAVLQTDESTAFVNLADCIDTHVSEISSIKKGRFNLRWVHITISYPRRNLQKHHMVFERMLQNYLNEFCYKLNRRYLGRYVDRLS